MAAFVGLDGFYIQEAVFVWEYLMSLFNSQNNGVVEAKVLYRSMGPIAK